MILGYLYFKMKITAEEIKIEFTERLKELLSEYNADIEAYNDILTLCLLADGKGSYYTEIDLGLEING